MAPRRASPSQLLARMGRTGPTSTWVSRCHGKEGNQTKMETLQATKRRRALEIVPILSEGAESLGQLTPTSLGDDQLLDSYSQTIAAVVRRVTPSVVNIRVLSGARGPG